ncbi:MAG: T9SS type A sorting domain-containing protein [Saprospiraceae bacterium]
MVLKIYILINFLLASASATSWPKCPSLSSDPIFIVAEDSLTIFLPGWNAVTDFEYTAFGNSGILRRTRQQGNLLQFSNEDELIGVMQQIEFKRLCNGVVSRRSTTPVKANPEIRKVGGYVKKYGTCTYVKSLLGGKGFKLSEWHGNDRSPELIHESPALRAQFTASFYTNIGELYISSKEEPNVLYVLEENALALEGFPDFEDANNLLTVKSISKKDPACDKESGEVSVEFAPKVKQQLYFSIDNGGHWYPEPIFSNLAPGDYRILVRAGLESCVYAIADSFYIGDKDIIDVTNISVQKANSCGSLGSIKISINRPETKTYILNDMLVSNTPFFENLMTGVYDLKIVFTEGGNCNAFQQSIEVGYESILRDEDIIVKDATNCNGSDGEIQIRSKGNLEFSIDHGETWKATPTFKGLKAGAYILRVRTKDKLCNQSTEVNVNAKSIRQSDGIKISGTNPICFGANDGVLILTEDAKTPVTHYIWHEIFHPDHNWSTVLPILNNVAAGKYEVKIFTSPVCYETRSITLKNPTKVSINNPLDVEIAYICQGSQILAEMNANKDLVYEWYNNNKYITTGNNAYLGLNGKYSVVGINNVGCKDTTGFEIRYNNEVFKPDFLLPSVGLVNDTIIGVDVTLISPDSITWIFPNEADILSSNFGQLVMSFASLGNFSVIMEAYKGGCKSVIEKGIKITDDPSLVDKDEQRSSKAFRSFKVYPNPNDGQFTIDYELNEAFETRILIFDHLGNNIFSKSIPNTIGHKEEIALQSVPPGIYIVMVNTSSEVQTASVIIH